MATFNFNLYENLKFNGTRDIQQVVVDGVTRWNAFDPYLEWTYISGYSGPYQHTFKIGSKREDQTTTCRNSTMVRLELNEGYTRAGYYQIDEVARVEHTRTIHNPPFPTTFEDCTPYYFRVSPKTISRFISGRTIYSSDFDNPDRIFSSSMPAARIREGGTTTIVDYGVAQFTRIQFEIMNVYYLNGSLKEEATTAVFIGDTPILSSMTRVATAVSTRYQQTHNISLSTPVNGRYIAFRDETNLVAGSGYEALEYNMWKLDVWGRRP